MVGSNNGVKRNKKPSSWSGGERIAGGEGEQKICRLSATATRPAEKGDSGGEKRMGRR